MMDIKHDPGPIRTQKSPRPSPMSPPNNGGTAALFDPTPASPKSITHRVNTACMYCRQSKMKCLREDPSMSCKRCIAAKMECVTKPRQSGRRPRHSVESNKQESNATSLQVPPPPPPPPYSSVSPRSPYAPLQQSLHPHPINSSHLVSEPSLRSASTTNSTFSIDSSSRSGGESYVPVHSTSPHHTQHVLPPGNSNQQHPLTSITTPPTVYQHQHHQHTPKLLNNNHLSKMNAGNLAQLLEKHGSHHNHLRSDTPKYTTSPLDLLANVGLREQRHLPSHRFDQYPLPNLSGNSTSSLSSPGRGESLELPRSHPVDHVEYFARLPYSQSFYHPDLDPMILGYVSPQEAERCYYIFKTQLDRILTMLDYRLHTLSYIRNSSTFLFTALCFTASKFIPEYATLSHRLEAHVNKLVARVLEQGGTSLETVQGFLMICPWLDPGAHVSIDQTALYLSMAITKFQELQRRTSLVGDAEHAANLHNDPAYKRSYERTLLTLFTYDRGLSLTMDRPWLLRDEELVNNVEKWSEAEDATRSDKNISGLSSIRRDLYSLLNSARNDKDGGRLKSAPSVVKAIVDDFINDWKAKWLSTQETDAYMHVVSQHSALSILVASLKHHTGNPANEAQILHQCLAAAINTCRTALSGAERILYIPNNTCVMLSYAATLTMKLSSRLKDTNTSIETGIFDLVQKVSALLETIGAHPPHRMGRATIYGLRLRSLLQEHAASRCSSPPQTILFGGGAGLTPTTNGSTSDAAGRRSRSQQNGNAGNNAVAVQASGYELPVFSESNSNQAQQQAMSSSTPKMNVVNMSDAEFSELLDSTLAQMDWNPISLNENEIFDIFQYSELLGDMRQQS